MDLHGVTLRHILDYLDLNVQSAGEIFNLVQKFFMGHSFSYSLIENKKQANQIFATRPA
jgi:hypothetical protein